MPRALGESGAVARLVRLPPPSPPLIPPLLLVATSDADGRGALAEGLPLAGAAVDVPPSALPLPPLAGVLLLLAEAQLLAVALCAAALRVKPRAPLALGRCVATALPLIAALPPLLAVPVGTEGWGVGVAAALMESAPLREGGEVAVGTALLQLLADAAAEAQAEAVSAAEAVLPLSTLPVG